VFQCRGIRVDPHESMLLWLTGRLTVGGAARLHKEAMRVEIPMNLWLLLRGTGFFGGRDTLLPLLNLNPHVKGFGLGLITLELPGATRLLNLTDLPLNLFQCLQGLVAFLPQALFGLTQRVPFVPQTHLGVLCQDQFLLQDADSAAVAIRVRLWGLRLWMWLGRRCRFLGRGGCRSGCGGGCLTRWRRDIIYSGRRRGKKLVALGGEEDKFRDRNIFGRLVAVGTLVGCGEESCTGR